MSRRLLVGLVVGVAVMALAAPVGAVKYGEPDLDPELFPSVGLLVVLLGDGGIAFCTGTLIDPDSVLTAGHCTEGAVAAAVNFKQDLSTPELFQDGEAFATEIITHPVHDLGIMNIPPGSFPDLAPMSVREGPLDEFALGRKPVFGIAGYGDVATNGIPFTNPVQPDNNVFPLQRHRGEVRLVNLPSITAMRVTAAPGTGGGFCFGDSGAPLVFEGDVVAIFVSINSPHCDGISHAFRLDDPDIQEWISDNT